jgi:hypothetical protein
MSLQINPCKAVMQKVKDANCDINTINELCYGISNAYGVVYGPEIKSELDKQCADLITKKKCVLGKNTCGLRRPVPPPFFNQVPHFFPALLKQTNNVEKAYNQCCMKCTGDIYENECLDNCKLEAEAVVIQKKEGYRAVQKEDGYRENPYGKKHHNHREKINYDGYKNAHPVVFFIGFGFVTIMIVFLVWFFMRGLATKN